MALRIEKAFGDKMDTLMWMQSAYDDGTPKCYMLFCGESSLGSSVANAFFVRLEGDGANRAIVSGQRLAQPLAPEHIPQN
jgi:hypothetical protein